MKKNYTISIPVVSFWKVLIPTVLICAGAGGLIGWLIVDKIIMPQIVHVNRGMVAVPSIEGLPAEDARQALYDAGLRMQIETNQYDAKVPRQCVISQQPPSGESVKKGRMVTVVLSKGTQSGEIPDVRNQPERKALLALKAEGFTLGTIRRVYSADYPKDAIMDMTPSPGTVINKETPIDIVVCSGEDPGETAVVPDVVGETIADAKQKIEAAGLKVGSITYENDASQMAGTVITQSVSPTISVSPQTAVNLVVAVNN